MRNPKMTKGHFELIAETIRFAQVEPAARTRMAREFAQALRATNPNFNPERFIEAATKPLADELAQAAE